MTARHATAHTAEVSPVDYQSSYSLDPKRRSKWRWVLRIGIAGAGLVFVASILLTNMCKAREPANRIKCANNMRQIALAAIQYANDHGGAFPASLHELAASTAGDLGEGTFYCPSGEASPSDSGLKLAESAIVEQKISYVYCGNTLRPDIDHPETAVILYEQPGIHTNDGMKVHIEMLADHSGDGMYVGFADGHVEWIAAPDLTGLLQQVTNGVRPIRFTYNATIQP